MKNNHFWLIVLLFSISFVSCNSEENNSPTERLMEQKVTFMKNFIKDGLPAYHNELNNYNSTFKEAANAYIFNPSMDQLQQVRSGWQDLFIALKKKRVLNWRQFEDKLLYTTRWPLFADATDIPEDGLSADDYGRIPAATFLEYLLFEEEMVEALLNQEVFAINSLSTAMKHIDIEVQDFTSVNHIDDSTESALVKHFDHITNSLTRYLQDTKIARIGNPYGIFHPSQEVSPEKVEAPNSQTSSLVLDELLLTFNELYSGAYTQGMGYRDILRDMDQIEIANAIDLAIADYTAQSNNLRDLDKDFESNIANLDAYLDAISEVLKLLRLDLFSGLNVIAESDDGYCGDCD